MERKPCAVIYKRVSTLAQAEEGVSLAAQESKIRAWAEVNGYEVAGVYEDAGISGGKADNRPGLQAALSHVCKIKGALIVYSLSRLARSTKDAIAISERLDKAGADLVSLSEKIDTTSATGKMFYRLLSILNEFERDQISERTKAAMQYLKRQGRCLGPSAPFGWDRGPEGRLTPNPTETAILARLNALRCRENRSFAQVAERLNAEGWPAKHGGKWSAGNVYSVFRSQVEPIAA